MKKLSLLLVPMALFLLLSPADGLAMMHGEEGHRPYGGYCRGPKWGWYGAHHRIRTVEEVRQLLVEYLGETGFSVGEIRDRGPFFEADILDVEGTGAQVVDVLIVDKGSGRIRSKF